METVNAWIAAVLGCLAILAAGAAGLRWLLAAMTKQMRIIATETTQEIVDRAAAGLSDRIDGLSDRIDGVASGLSDRIDGVASGLSDRIDGVASGLSDRIDGLSDRMDGFDERFDRMEVRMDRSDAKLDHIAEVVDLRMRPLEADMSLVKQHLLGKPAA